MTASSGVSASSRTIGGVISDLEQSGLEIEDGLINRVIDAIIADYIHKAHNARNITFGPIGGVGRVVLAEPVLVYGDELTNPWVADESVPSQLVFKAVTGGSCQMADRESIIQTVIAERTEGRTSDGSPVVPRVLESDDITFEDYYLDVLCALKGAPLRPLPENASYETRASLEQGIEQQIRELVLTGKDEDKIRMGSQELSVADIKRVRNARIPLISMEQLKGIALMDYLHAVDPAIQQSSLIHVHGDSVESMMPKQAADDDSLPLRKRLNLVKAISDAYDLFHETEYVHRDAKPANIFLTNTKNGEYVAKIIDCGTVKSEGDALEKGLFVGTMKYAAPEQYSVIFMKDAPADPCAEGRDDRDQEVIATRQMDIFSLGVMFHSILKRTQLYGSKASRTLIDCYSRVYREERYLAGLSKAVDSQDEEYLDSPEGMIDRILYRCLRHNPKDRYESCRDLSADISKVIKKLDENEKLAHSSSGLYRLKGDERERVGDGADILLYGNNAIVEETDPGSAHIVIDFDPEEFEQVRSLDRKVA